RYWGKGIASESMRLLLVEVPVRPLRALVAVSNVASTRVLEKCGFEETGRRWSTESDRFVECEEVIMELSE
ncbi:MAG: GNAT family protein, partial [Planctomycetota bacterium]